MTLGGSITASTDYLLKRDVLLYYRQNADSAYAPTREKFRSFLQWFNAPNIERFSFEQWLVGPPNELQKKENLAAMVPLFGPVTADDPGGAVGWQVVAGAAVGGTLGCAAVAFATWHSSGIARTRPSLVGMDSSALTHSLTKHCPAPAASR